MKKVLALLLALVTLMSCLIACSGKDPAPATSSESATSGSTSEKTSEVMSEFAELAVGTVRLTNVGTGKMITYDCSGTTPKLDIANQENQSAIGLNFVVQKGVRAYALEFAATEKKPHNDKKNVVFDNIEINNNAIGVKNFKDGILEIGRNSKGNPQLWYAKENADGSYSFLCRSNKGFALTMENDDLVIRQDVESNNAKWRIERISENNDFYREFVSDEGNVAVRVPLDVFQKTTITAERLVQWASDISDLMHVYDEMTQFHPHDTIFIHAYNYQGVMAGVIGTDQVFVNCGPNEWFYTDLQKMQDRTEAGYHDVSWMAMHEIGHLYDQNRDWNFEGECHTDIKVMLALLAKEDEGWVAAPAEYNAKTVFGFHKNKEKKIGSAAECCYGLGGSSMRKEYSIYHMAGVFADIIDKIGSEPFYKLFNWFQNEMKGEEKPNGNLERFELYLSKLSEYSGQDVKSMIKEGEYQVCVAAFSK